MTVSTDRVRVGRSHPDEEAASQLPWASVVALERTAAAVRTTVVTSSIVLFAAEPHFVSDAPVLWTTLGIAFAYAVLILVNVQRLRRQALQWTITLMDAALTLAVVAVTGGSTSLAVAVLFLVAVTVVQRFGMRTGGLLLFAIVAANSAIGLAVHHPQLTFGGRLAHVLWWDAYLGMTGVLAGALTHLAVEETRRRQQIQQDAADEARRHLDEDLVAREREDTIRTILHDLVSPVTSISALTNHLATSAADGSDGAPATNVVQLLHQNAAYIADMCDTLRRSIQGPSPLAAFSSDRPTRVALRPLVEAAVAEQAAQALVHVAMVPDDAQISVDATVLTRILRNLVGNAVRYNPATAPPVELTVRATETSLSVSVGDHGPGLTPEEMSLAVHKGTRLRTGSDNGQGLGLWIVDRLVRQYGGELQLTSPPGGGLVASFALPIAMQPSAGQAPTDQAPTGQAPTDQPPIDQAPNDQAPAAPPPAAPSPTGQAPTAPAPADTADPR